jgi:putative sterol carrier protein
VAYLFPSDAWAKQLQVEVNHSEAYRSSAKTWEGDFYFIVNPEKGTGAIGQLYLDLWHGECRDAFLVAGDAEKHPEFVIAGTMATYRKIFEHKLDPIQALMTRQLKLEGNMMKVMRAVKATLDLVNCCSLIDTAYPEPAQSV